MLRVATFNVENLFERPRAMNLESWNEGQPAISAAAELNNLFNEACYADDDKQRMLALLAEWGLLATRPRSDLLELRKIRGSLFKVPRTGDPSIVAQGRADWIGWIDLKTETIADTALENTARVIAEVNPDVLVVVEVESRPALARFAASFLDDQLRSMGHPGYRYNMVIDGNDDRGIDVGILSRYPIRSMRSHIDDRMGEVPMFSRDCPEYYVDLPGERDLVVLPNHFSSKGSDPVGFRRRKQAAAVARIYRELSRAHDLVMVAGDLNDNPTTGSLDPLLRKTDLTDAMALPCYSGLPGTYQRATAAEKIDYLLLSPTLAERVTAVDVCRKGFYAPRKWESFETINKETKDRAQASDHHCLWADIEL